MVELIQNRYKDIINSIQFYNHINKIKIILSTSYPRQLSPIQNTSKLKQKIQKLMKLLEFICPNNHSLIQKYYIIDRFVHNNQMASQQQLVNRVQRFKAQKTKAINFLLNNHDDNKDIFLCQFTHNKGTICKFNKNFQHTIQIKNHSMHGVKLKNILPSYWRDAHQQKMNNLQQFQLNYEHEPHKNYYILTLASQKYVQVQQLHVIPYFQLNSNVLFLASMRASKHKIINIQQVKQDQADQNIEQLTVSKRSQSKVTFKHQIYEDNNLNAIDQSQKIVQVFGKKYSISTRTRWADVVTKNFLQIQSQKINQDIQAIIQFGKQKNDVKTKQFEQAKKQVDLFKLMKNKLIFWTVLLAFLFAGGDVGIADSFRIYNYMISRAVLLQLKFRQTFIGTITFQSVLLQLGTVSQIDETGQLAQLIQSQSSNHYLAYHNYVDSLILQVEYRDIVFQQYQSIDFDNTTNIHTIAQHMTLFSVISNSATQKINKKGHSHWILADYQQDIKKLMDVYNNPNYLQNKVIHATKMMLLSKVSASKIVFWFCQLATILSPLFGLFVFIRAKLSMESTLCKPLQMSQTQLQVVKSNTKLLSKYLSMQVVSQQSKQQSIFNMIQYGHTDTQMISMCSIAQKDIIVQEKVTKNKTGIFTNHCFFIPVVFGFYLLGLLMCSLRLYYSKSSHAHNIDAQLSYFQIFAALNNQMFILYGETIQYILNQQSIEKLQAQSIRLQNIYKIDITTTIQQMLLDPGEAPTILSANPCTWTSLCSGSITKLNPYPVQISYFLSNINILLSLLKNNHTINNQRVLELIKQTFKSAKLIYQMSHQIFNINYQSIAQAYINQFLWIGLSYVGVAGYMAMMIIQTIRMIKKSKKYGQQILSLFPSSQISSFKAISFQVNCIFYRTNFAKTLGHS